MGYNDAIASIESSGRYDLLGPVTKSGDRAYGKYQVMGANVGPWTEEVLGRKLTPEEFASNPQAQDAVFNAKFGTYVNKYGPEGAARAWFAGEKGMNDPNRKDILGTTVAQYADKFNRANGSAPMPGMPQIMGGAGPDESGMPPILQPDQGGLAGMFQDPQKMAYLAMIAKGLSPWSSLDPQAMLEQAQKQKLAQANQLYERQKDQRDFGFRQQESQRAQGNNDRSFDLQKSEAEQPKYMSRPDGSIVALPKTGTNGQPQQIMPAATAPSEAAKAANDSGLTDTSDPAYKKFITDWYAKKTNGLEDQVTDRQAAAAKLGLKPNSPEYRSYVLTGKMPREDQQPLTATDKKAIMEADDAVLSSQTAIDNLKQAKELSKKAYEGPLASQRGYATSLIGSEGGQATSDLNNLVTTNALSQLKAIFGGNPTEGERAILLDIQGSASQPDSVRQKIYDRAAGLAQRRLDYNKQRADELRGGSFYKQGGASASQPAQPAAGPSRADLEAEARRRGLIQ